MSLSPKQSSRIRAPHMRHQLPYGKSLASCHGPGPGLPEKFDKEAGDSG